MNLTGGNDGVVGNGGRSTSPWRAEIAYVRRDSFWIEHEGELDGTAGGAPTAPIFVEDRGHAADPGAPAPEGPLPLPLPLAGELEIPARGWAKLSSPWILALTASAFAMGIGVSPLVRAPRPPAPAPVSATIAPPPPAAAAVLPAAPAPAAPACAPTGSEGVATEAQSVAHGSAHASARAAARNRSSSGLGAGASNPVWSSRHHQKKAAAADAMPAPETTASPDEADVPAAKPSEKQLESAPTKKEGPAPATAPKKPAAKAWVDPWAGGAGAVRAG